MNMFSMVRIYPHIKRCGLESEHVLSFDARGSPFECASTTAAIDVVMLQQVKTGIAHFHFPRLFTSMASLEMGTDKYKVLFKIGEGAQGIILKAELKAKPGEYVAVKKLRDSKDKNGLSIDTIREIYMLRELDHPNVIKILDIFGRSGVMHIIMPFAVGDLEQLIQNKEVLLTPAHIKQYMTMLLRGVQHLHHKYILHRDLKPANCLILTDNTLAISDFGMSREYGSPNRQLSWQACTIWYRSPELLLGASQYGTGLDQWSAGCIFAELLLRVPIFGGNDHTEIAQIGRIFRILGTPNFNPDSGTAKSEKIKTSAVYWKDYEMLPKFRKYEPNEQYPVDNLLKACSQNAKELFLGLCKYDPNKRLTATQALDHEYFQEQPEPTPVKLLPNPKSKSPSRSNTPQPNV